VVFVVHDSTVERRAVRLGAASGDRVVVLAGVSPGERVAVGDLGRLKDGADIHIEP
jgi:multidrug efflux pump subunit AcrA (membrane-fusion protein)